MKFLQLILFNFYTRGYLKASGQYFFLLNRRFKAMVTDMLFVLAIFLPVILILMVAEIIGDTTGATMSTKFNGGTLISLIFFSIILFILLNKDFYNARSVAKRKYGYQIYDVKIGKPANSIKCMIRNITMFIWPVEAIILLFNPYRRLGDIIAGTILVEQSPENPELILEDMKNNISYQYLRRTLILSIIITILLDFLAAFPKLI